jgi:hypothetical protein
MRQFGALEAAIMDRLWEWGRPTLVRDPAVLALALGRVPHA